ncbi:MAG: hypothetical protein WEC14_08735 [Chloroflexota bacterium]
MAVTPIDPGPLRPGLRRLSLGLIGYGVVGLVLAMAGLLVLVSVGGRVTSAVDRTSAQVESLVATLEGSSRVLRDAGSSAISFAVTLERTPPSVRQVASTMGNLQGNLRTVESQLGSLSILGARPLADVARLFGQMATDIDGLDTRLEGIAADLEDNKAKLLTNATSLKALGDRLDAIAADLDRGTIQDGLADLPGTLTILALLIVAWMALPAAGALALGWWLRRLLS